MTMPTPKLPDPPSPEHAHFYYLGNIAAAWATLEFEVNRTIWVAGKIDQRLAACITANIPSMPARLNTVISLAYLRGADKILIKKFVAFKNDTFKLSNLRNRAIHDYWFHHMWPDGTIVPVAQWRVTAKGDKPPEYETESISIEDMKETIKKIMDHKERYLKLHQALLDQIQS